MLKILGEKINDEEVTRQILHKFTFDETGKLCQSDPVVIRLGREAICKIC